ncbi:MAG: hypothetical protein IT348_01710 [Candidatus Eisenbacteria bacterium]|nr:hypothetical protein [Candidatus Eisenbacteria bacterium]
MTTTSRKKSAESAAVAPAALALARTGHLDGLDDEGRVRFLPEGETTSEPAAIAAGIADATLLRAVRNKARALAIRTADPTPSWVVIGLVRERLSGDAVNRKGALEVRYEGESLHLAADRDLTLVCGKAKLTLRFDGRIELNGTNILSASRGPHRIKGATVAIN